MFVDFCQPNCHLNYNKENIGYNIKPVKLVCFVNKKHATGFKGDTLMYGQEFSLNVFSLNGVLNNF